MSDPHLVLAVDDDSSFAELIADYLEKEDDRFNVNTATSPSIALELLEETEYDAIISDYQMPDMSGIDFLATIREEWDRDIPFIIFTGKSRETIAIEALNLGADRYLQKGGDPASQFRVLVDAVQNEIEKRQAENELEQLDEELKAQNQQLEAYTNQLEATERQLRTLIGNLPGIVYRCREERGWPMDMIRGEVEALTGYSAREFEQGDVLWGEDVIHPEDRQRVWEEIDAALSDGRSFEVRYKLRTKDGEERWVWEQGKRVTHDASEPNKIEGFITDITENIERQREIVALQERFELAINGAGLGIWDWNQSTDEVEFNDNLATMLGYDPDEIATHLTEWKQRVHPEDIEVLETAIAEHNAGESEYYDAEFRVRTATGEWKWIRTIGQSTERDADGNSRRAVGINIDIDDRKSVKRELQRERDRLAALHEATTEIEGAQSKNEVYETLVKVADDILDFALVAVDVVKEDVFVNKAWSRTETGEYYETLPLDGESLVSRAYHSGETIVANDLSDYDATPADPAYKSALTVPIGDIGTFQAVSNDTAVFDTVDREFVELLVGHAREALHRIDQQRSLREQRERLRDENERLEEFASFVSHDLRNPMNVAFGRLELAQNDCDSEHLAVVERSLDRMDQLITDLLTLAREGRTVGEVEAVDLDKVVHQCWNTVETADADLQTETPPTIRGDRNRLRTVLENLIRNAIQHGDEDVTVTIGGIEDIDGFFVADDGDGIDVDDPTTIFESGFSTDTDGTGLGLSIVQQIVEAHGWEITVTESQSGGARFEITDVTRVKT